MFRKLTLAAALVAGLAAAAPAAAERFDFVALGDTAYNEGDGPKYDALIASINRTQPAFVIHVGDTWGAEPCTEAQHRSVLATFAKFEPAVFYTPGDTEWTDCRKPEVIEAYHRYVKKQATAADMALLAPLVGLDAQMRMGGYDDGLASLALIRRLYFAKPESLGQKPLPMVRQADVSEFKEFAENARWEKGGVVFATVNVPGSNNDFTMTDERRATEAVRRNRANVEWIKAAFAEAKAKNAKAVVIALQAGMFLDERGNEQFGKAVRGGAEGPYWWVARAIQNGADAFGKPVLLINGDFHEFVVDKPFTVSGGEEKAAAHDNITRVQVYGAPDLRAVRISVDTETPWVFGFTPLW
jgi:hypothetical protein